MTEKKRKELWKQECNKVRRNKRKMNIDEMKDRIARAEEIQRYTENRCEALENEISELKKRNGELAGQKASLERWFGEAKKLLAKWVELFKSKGGNIPPTPIQVDTEQFLKDLEKDTRKG